MVVRLSKLRGALQLNHLLAMPLAFGEKCIGNYVAGAGSASSFTCSLRLCFVRFIFRLVCTNQIH